VEKAADTRGIDRVLVGRPATDGAGVRMTRIIATPELDHFDPFLLLDEFRSDDADDYIAGFPDHPHRGFETVTYMLAGHMAHADNQGNRGELGPGSVQWMTAGRGIVHSEMPRQDDGLMWGFQLWVNLPASDKMTAPRYQDIPASDVPRVEPGAGVEAQVIAGELAGSTGPVAGVATAPIYYDMSFSGRAEARVPTPAHHNVFVYVFEGSVHVMSDRGGVVSRGEIALLHDGESVVLRSDTDARCLVVGGRPLAEPIARYGPFVMNTQEEILKAISDYQSGQL
jgi:redox-sensitive bicupin YhaK (pirin superfamily)